MLLSISNVSKAYGDNQVLNDVSLSISLGQKIGLVGANGVGKSTLLKLIVSELEPDTGAVATASNVEIGYLPQVLAAAADQTIDQLINASQGDLRCMEARLRELEQQMADPNGKLDIVLDEYSQLTEQFERRGGYDLEHRMGQVFAGLGIDHLPRDRAIATLSGGEKSRVGLAALLLRAPDLFLLDEPTNHLDFAALEWLEEYLQGYQGGLLVVSHDRLFLNRTVNTIVEIVEHSREAKAYTGNYDFYAELKIQERAKWVESYWLQQEEIWELRKAIKGKAYRVAPNRAPRDGDKMAYDFKAGRIDGVISRNIRAAEEKLRRIEEDAIPKPPQELSINPDFDPRTLTTKTPITVSQVSKAYGEQVLLDQVGFTLEPRSRVVIVGPNGAGKSTLLKIMSGIQRPDSGDVIMASSVVLGHLDQEQETLVERGILFDAYRADRVGEFEEFKAELLKYGLFVWQDLGKPVANLSVGQKRKLQIAMLIAQQANLLLLDEPTNHISLDVLEEFETALLNFPGPILAVSHDRRFIQRFADEIWELRDGRLTRYLGGWDEYRRRTVNGFAERIERIVAYDSVATT